MRCALVFVLLTGCIPVSYWTSPEAIKDAASTLRRDGSAAMQVDEIDDHAPEEDGSWVDTTEQVRMGEPIRVRLSAQVSRFAMGEPPGPEQSMTVADLFVDCPDDLDNSDANRRDYPRCKLFRAQNIELRRGHRADVWKIVIATAVVATAADVACIIECSAGRSNAATFALGLGGVATLVATIAYGLHELGNIDAKHGNGHR